jgi:hypothetical protein
MQIARWLSRWIVACAGILGISFMAVYFSEQGLAQSTPEEKQHRTQGETIEEIKQK